MTEKKHSGFEAPAIGTVYPKGTTFKKNANGTLTPVFPKSKKPGKNTSKK